MAMPAVTVSSQNTNRSTHALLLYHLAPAAVGVLAGPCQGDHAEHGIKCWFMPGKDAAQRHGLRRCWKGYYAAVSVAGSSSLGAVTAEAKWASMPLVFGSLANVYCDHGVLPSVRACMKHPVNLPGAADSQNAFIIRMDT